MRFEFTGKAQEVIAKMFAFVEEWHANGNGEEPLFDVKEHREKRSLDQNAYYWLLLGKLARVLGYSHDELHRYMLGSYGVYEVMLIGAEVPLRDYFKYFDVVGTGYVYGKLYNHVRVFKGSSEMDTTEFSRLLEGMIAECREQGIETKTPAEIAAMEYAEMIA